MVLNPELRAQFNDDEWQRLNAPYASGSLPLSSVDRWTRFHEAQRNGGSILANGTYGEIRQKFGGILGTEDENNPTQW